jgi:hypothetical protein
LEDSVLQPGRAIDPDQSGSLLRQSDTLSSVKTIDLKKLLEIV